MARPPKFNNPEELEKVFDEYKNNRIDPDKKINFVSIVDFCNFADIGQSTFYDYEKKPGFRQVIKRIRSFIVSIWEQQLLLPGRNTTGAIFWLKNFGGMADKVEHQHSGSIEHQHQPKLDNLSDDQLELLKSAFNDDEPIDVTPEED